jgi:hypothetical protein
MKLLRLLLVILTATTLLAEIRLDSNQLRNDLFASMAGNADALKRVLDATQKVLIENPDHAQALVWHGAATLNGVFIEAEREIRRPRCRNSRTVSRKWTGQSRLPLTTSKSGLFVRFFISRPHVKCRRPLQKACSKSPN